MTTTLTPELLDQLLAGYEKPEDLTVGALASLLAKAGLALPRAASDHFEVSSGLVPAASSEWGTVRSRRLVPAESHLTNQPMERGVP